MQNNSRQQKQQLDNPRAALPNQEVVLEAQVNKGLEAKEFLRVLEGGSKYFLMVLNELQNELLAELVNLKPQETEQFTILKASLDCLYKPLSRVHEDIENGKMAEDTLSGKQEKGGLL